MNLVPTEDIKCAIKFSVIIFCYPLRSYQKVALKASLTAKLRSGQVPYQQLR